MSSLRSISRIALAALPLLGASCATYKKMPGKYVVYDTTAASSPKSYVEFFTYNQLPSGVLGKSFSEEQQTRVKILHAGKEDYIGTIGMDGCERLRIVLPPGQHHFHVGPGINDADLNLVTQKDKVIPVEANSSTSVGSQLAFGAIGWLATTKCETKVGPPRPCNPNDREWVPLKR